MSERTILYLRGMPTRVVRDAKAAAARRGTTLAAFVSDALERTVHEVGGVAEGSSGELQDAMRWYEENRPRLLSRYRGEYVAISGGKVVDHDPDYEALATRVFGRLGVRSIFMPRVLEPETRVRVRSPRLRR